MNRKRAWSTFFLIIFPIVMMQAQVHLISAKKMNVDARYDTTSDKSMMQVMAFYKARLGEDISRPVGTCAKSMTAGLPESLLSDFLADQLFLKANQSIPGGVDFCVINVGSIRASLKRGVITVADLYKVMPFENELVVLELKGSDVWTIFRSIARAGGAGVSNVNLEMAGNKVCHLLIGGASPENNKLYRVATMDYLADGNSGMSAFLHAVNRFNTGLKVRNIYIEQIEKLTTEGKSVDVSLDGRIKLIKE